MFKPEETTGVIAIDNGGSEDRVMTIRTSKSYPSTKGIITHNFHMEREWLDTDYLVNVDGVSYGVGSLVEESSLPLRMHTESKCNLYYDISILLACHQFGYEKNYIINCVPVASHTKEEREGLSERLVKEWEVTVNGVYKKFSIEEVKAMPESGAAFFVNKPEGTSRFVNLGSRTTNYATVVHDDRGVRFINNSSGTFFKYGLEAAGIPYGNYNGGLQLATYICGQLLAKWNKNDNVFLLGGGALNKGIVDGFKKFFPNATVMDNPKKADLRGMWELGKEVYSIVKK